MATKISKNMTAKELSKKYSFKELEKACGGWINEVRRFEDGSCMIFAMDRTVVIKGINKTRAAAMMFLALKEKEAI